jgi:hypothetical protein
MVNDAEKYRAEDEAFKRNRRKSMMDDERPPLKPFPTPSW